MEAALKVINPETGRKINVNGRIYNDLIADGYILKRGELVKKKKEKKVKEKKEKEKRISKSPIKKLKPLEIEEERMIEQLQELNLDMMPVFEKQQFDEFFTVLPSVRCKLCGKVTGALYPQYEKLKAQGMEPRDIFEKLNVKRVCCRNELAFPPRIPHIDEPQEIKTQKMPIGGRRPLYISYAKQRIVK